MQMIPTNHSRNTSSDAGVGLAVLLAAPFAVMSIAQVFAASSYTAGALLLAIAGLGLFAALSENRPKVASALLFLAGVWATFAGYTVFQWHWLAFTPATWVFNGLFVAALFAGVWRKLDGWGKALAALFAGSLAISTILFPRPQGGEGPLDSSEEWKIDVAVVDRADGLPLENARVLCGTVMRWENRLKLADAGASTTDADGKATWEFDEDPRLKVSLCTVWKDADQTHPGYSAQTQVAPAPAVGGGRYRLTFALEQNSHPEAASPGA